MEWSQYPSTLLAATRGYRVPGRPAAVRGAWGRWIAANHPTASWFASGRRLRPYRLVDAPAESSILWTLPIADDLVPGFLDSQGWPRIPVSMPAQPLARQANALSLFVSTPIVASRHAPRNHWGFQPPSPDWLPGLLGHHLSRLVKCYLDPSWVPQTPTVSPAVLVEADGQILRVRHRSTHSPGVFSGDGWVGFALWQTPQDWMATWLPWFHAGNVWGVGSGTPWGHGQFTADPVVMHPKHLAPEVIASWP